MGSFMWDDEYRDMCYSHHHHGRPLSVALTEPLDPFELQPTSFFDDIPYVESDFASLRHHHHHHHRHHRSRSSGRRFKREYYSVYCPNGNHHSYCFSPPSIPPPPPPPILRRPVHRTASREVLFEKIETVTIEEQQRRPTPHYMVSFIRAPSPPVRQLKIRPRPSSCYDLHKETIDIHHNQQKENRCSKQVEEHHEEHYQYNYNYNYNKTPERVVPIEREPPTPPPPPPRIILYDATTSTEDLYIPRPPTPKPVRPETRDTGTTTAGLPRRPLCMTETQIIERFEKTEKVRCDSASSIEEAGSTYDPHIKRLLNDVEYVAKQHHRTSKKSHRKEFMQRMHARNGTLSKAYNSLNHYSAADRQREKSRVIVRSTSKPREILVDTSGIFGCPGEFSEPNTPQAVGSNSSVKFRSPFQPPDLI